MYSCSFNILFMLPFNKKILKLLCGDLPKNLSHSSVNTQLVIGQLVDSASEIGADWVIASQDCFGCLCNPVTSKYHSLHIPNNIDIFDGGSSGILQSGVCHNRLT